MSASTLLLIFIVEANAWYGELPEYKPAQNPDRQLKLSDNLCYRQQDQQVIFTGQEVTFTRHNGEGLWFYSIRRPSVLAEGSVQVPGADSSSTGVKQTQLDLNPAKKAAECNARARQNFLTNMSHDIRPALHGVLAMAQPGAGKIRTEAIAFNLRDVLRSNLELLLPRAQEKGIALELNALPASAKTSNPTLHLLQPSQVDAVHA